MTGARGQNHTRVWFCPLAPRPSLRHAHQIRRRSGQDRHMAATVDIILARVRRVPEGFVTTYGDLSPGAPRQAGRALAACNR